MTNLWTHGPEVDPASGLPVPGQRKPCLLAPQCSKPAQIVRTEDCEKALQDRAPLCAKRQFQPDVNLFIGNIYG